jgi:hypothetical protein
MREFAVSLLLVLLAQPAAAGGPPSLTGTWEGSILCKTESDEGKAKFDSGPVTLLVTQLGPSGPLVLNLFSKGSGAYSGTIVPSAVKPGEGTGAMIACGTNDGTTTSVYNEITTFHYKVGADGSGSLKTSGVFVLNSVYTGVCKGTWRRTSTMSKTTPCP